MTKRADWCTVPQVLSAQRQVRIIQQLQESGFVEISQLSNLLLVDRSTIRRDLQSLERRGLVARTRGGALPGPSSGLSDIPYAVKRIERTPEKQAIAEAAAALVQEGESVLLDSGSTTYQIARALRRRRDISVVTNDLNVSMCLADSQELRLLVTGGMLLESVYTLVGPQALQTLRDVHVDRVFLGADAIHHEAGITNVTFVEVEVKHAMIEAAREVVVVADSTKFGRRALARVCGLDDVHRIITDDKLDPSVAGLYGDRLMVAGSKPGDVMEVDGSEPLLHQ